MHRGKKRIAIALTSSLSLLAAGMWWIPEPQAKAPPLTCSPTAMETDSGTGTVGDRPIPGDNPSGSQPNCADSMSNATDEWSYPSEFAPLLQRYDTLLARMETVERNLAKQLNGKPYWEDALSYGVQASELGKTGNSSVETLQTLKSLWEEALENLHQIPGDSDYGDRAVEKIAEYQANLDAVSYSLEVAQSQFLIPIAERSGLSSQVKITICHLTTNTCRRLRGNEPARDAASLMKVPIAVALMNKITSEKLRFDTPIYVDPGNFTEDASDLRVGEKYPLQTILNATIGHSSNIGPNQIIDYLGWDYINQVLEERGFTQTRVYSKFVGDRIYPQNVAIGSNTTTSDDLTQMMIQIYNREHLGDEILIRSLERQYDHELGFAGLEGGFGHWLGEKTGQTSRVLGTTLAMNLFGETYIITVIDDGAYSEPTIRQFISEISEYLFRSGQL